MKRNKAKCKTTWGEEILKGELYFPCWEKCWQIFVYQQLLLCPRALFIVFYANSLSRSQTHPILFAWGLPDQNIVWGLLFHPENLLGENHSHSGLGMHPQPLTSSQAMHGNFTRAQSHLPCTMTIYKKMMISYPDWVGRHIPQHTPLRSICHDE